MKCFIQILCILFSLESLSAEYIFPSGIAFLHRYQIYSTQKPSEIYGFLRSSESAKAQLRMNAFSVLKNKIAEYRETLSDVDLLLIQKSFSQRLLSLKETLKASPLDWNLIEEIAKTFAEGDAYRFVLDVEMTQQRLAKEMLEEKLKSLYRPTLVQGVSEELDKKESRFYEQVLDLKRSLFKINQRIKRTQIRFDQLFVLEGFWLNQVNPVIQIHRCPRVFIRNLE
ncbi:MAG: hypothetical protein CL678_03365 [Bdellovibrionaceae bacterium]|nr:hypothetical protein [Pseudobdellovibrionaceae bacterium]|tara:strand:- start:627 stop:1304 length:678 start_codon:yes stop_codon:yes gene_type:complete